MSGDNQCLGHKVIQAELGIIIGLFLLFIRDYHKINNINNNNPNKNSNPNHNTNTNTNNITIFSNNKDKWE